eukprot:Em0006g766a
MAWIANIVAGTSAQSLPPSSPRANGHRVADFYSATRYRAPTGATFAVATNIVTTVVRPTENFDGTSWVAYDRQFRREAMARKDLNWSVTNARLYSEAFTGRARAIPRCRYCLSETHELRACPVNPDNLDPTTPRPTAYLYTTDLVALQACNSAQVPQLEFTESAIRTPLFHDAWVAALSSHPDRNFVTYICTGLRDGFRIGFARTAPLRSASANMFSAVQHPEIIDEYISKELRVGRILATNCHPAIHINSVNDGIDPDLCSLQYTTVEDVAGAAAKLGRDDFAIIGSPGSDEIHKSFSTLQSVCTRLGVPLAQHKTEGPATRITFLGITIDTQAGQLSLPDEKLERLRSLLVSWGDRKVCTKKELESLVGILNHACSGSQQNPSFNTRRALGNSTRPVNGLDVTRLDSALQGYFHNGLAPSTHRSYDCALRRFNSFCVEYSILDPFPVNEKLLCYFATKLANDGLAPQTIKVYLSAVRSMQLSLGLPCPREESTLPVLKRVLDGIRRAQATQNSGTPRIRMPITVTVLRQIRTEINRSPEAEPDRLAFCMGYCYRGILRFFPPGRVAGRHGGRVHGGQPPFVGRRSGRL